MKYNQSESIVDTAVDRLLTESSDGRGNGLVPGPTRARAPSPAVAAAASFSHAGSVTDRPNAAGSPVALAAALRSTGYLADDGIATAAFLALQMNRPLFCEGEPAAFGRSVTDPA